MTPPCRFIPLCAVAVFAFLLAGCEQTPEGKPMDKPLEPADAMAADEAMRQRAGQLVQEHQERSRSAAPNNPPEDRP